MLNDINLEQLSSIVRYRIVKTSHERHIPHLGSALSCVDILVSAYWNIFNVDPSQPNNPQRDKVILSKGHAANALYHILAMRGFFPVEDVIRINEDGGNLGEHPTLGSAPGIEASTGSLGHGLPIGVGFAYGAKVQQLAYQTGVVMSDGECNEGSVWEAAMLAPQLGLGNLMVVVDYNKWQATGRSNEVLSLAPLVDKWAAFGWDSVEVDGHDLNALTDAMRQAIANQDQPTAIIAHTVKGKGISFMEDDNNWHYRTPTAEEVELARIELGVAE